MTTSNKISHRTPEFSDFSLDDLGFADWSDDVREEIMRIVMATRPELTGDPYTAADVVKDLQEGYLGDVIFSALQKVGALNLIGFGESIALPVTVEKLRKRIVEETGESMRSVIKRTRGFTKEQVFDVIALIPLPPIPAITDDLRAHHDVAIFHANVRDRAARLYRYADNDDDEWTDYIDLAYAQISQRKPALVA